MKLSELAARIGGELKGGDVEITGISGIDNAGKGDITFVSNPKYFSKLKETSASAVIVGEGINVGIPCVVSKNPYLSFAKALSVLREPPKRPAKGISKMAVVESSGIPASVSIGAFSYISKNVKIGENAVIMPQVFIGEGSEIGDNAFIYPNVTARERTKIGRNVIIHSGTVIGSDGYGYVTDKGIHKKIPQTGNVIIEDDVEIGSNTSIDRAAIESTIIGQGTKIDNLVHIAHNVKIGKNCLILGQVGLAGSAEIGDNTTIASQGGVGGHLKIGKNVTIAARGGVIKDVEDGEVVSGFPARKHSEMMKVYAAMMKLPELVKELKSKNKKGQKRENQ